MSVPSDAHRAVVSSARKRSTWPAQARGRGPALPPRRASFTELREVLSTSTLVRNGILGAGLAITSAVAPLASRWLFGVLTFTSLLSSLLQFAAVTILGVAAMLVTIRWVLSSGYSLLMASVLGVLAGIPVMLATYAAALWVHLAFPHFELLDVHEPKSLQYQMITGLSDALPMMAVWASFVFVPTIVKTHQERQRELAMVRREAELLRLRSHLEPHFVLNTMNAIGGLVTDDPEQARELLAMLGDLFRDASCFDEHQTVAHEVAWLRRFVAIHELRFADQLEVTWDVNPATLDLSFPSLLLQPLVENALMHGALRRDRGTLSIRFTLEVPYLLVAEVRDNGPGLEAPRRDGKGLTLVERRLALESAIGDVSPAFSIDRDGDTTLARVKIPIRGPRQAAS